MAEIDLRRLPTDEFVLHFGGRPNEVDAFTFSNSLIALSEALQEVNRQISPQFGLEVTIEGVGPGSFRAKIKASLKSLGGLFKAGAGNLAISILSTLIVQRIFSDTPKIVVQDDLVVLESGSDRIIIPKSVWEAREKLPQPQQVERHVGRAFAVIEDDPSVTDFGILGHLDDKAPVAIIPREVFPRLSAPELRELTETRLYRDERAKLIVLRAILERSTTKRWQFAWRGIRISAPIRSEMFFDKLESREYWFAQGDVLEVLLRVHQERDSLSGAYLNTSYEVLEVYGIEHVERQGRMIGH